MAEAQEFDINALLDGTLDDLADVPEFKPYPKGAHVVLCSITGPKKIGEHPAFEIEFKAVETKELDDPEKDKPLEKGAETKLAYMMDNDFGQGNFKTIMRAAAEKFGLKSNRELIADVQGAEALIVVGIRIQKAKEGKPERQFNEIVNIAFL